MARWEDQVFRAQISITVMLQLVIAVFLLCGNSFPRPPRPSESYVQWIGIFPLEVFTCAYLLDKSGKIGWSGTAFTKLTCSSEVKRLSDGPDSYYSAGNLEWLMISS